MKLLTAKCWVMAYAITLPLSSIASEGLSTQEQKLLLKVSTEITYLKELVAKARGYQQKGRVVFDYDGLMGDLTDVQAAINRHTAVPLRTPRAVPALDKNYTKFGN